jgi:hypothetical protein
MKTCSEREREVEMVTNSEEEDVRNLAKIEK